MSELILPGHNPAPEVFYLVDKGGREIEVPAEDMWQHSPDASGEEYKILELGSLPYEEWEKGEHDV